MYCCTAVLSIMCCLQQLDVSCESSSPLFADLAFPPRFFLFFFWVAGLRGSWVTVVLFTAAAIGLQMSGFGHTLFPHSVFFFALFFVFYFGGLGGLIVADASILFFTQYHTQNIPVFGLPSHQSCGVPFFLAASLKPEKFPERSMLPPSNFKYVVPGNT